MSLTLNTAPVSSENSGASVAELCDRNLATAAGVYALAATGGATIAVGFVVVPEIAIIGCAAGGILGTVGYNQHTAYLKDKHTKAMDDIHAKRDAQNAAKSNENEVVS